MSHPGPLYRPFDELITIKILGKEFQVPAGNMLLRAMQYLSPEDVAMGRFCWNEECQYCRVSFKTPEGNTGRQALSYSLTFLACATASRATSSRIACATSCLSFSLM